MARFVFSAATVVVLALGQSPSPTAGPVPGKVLPKWSPTYNMTASTAIMICNNSGQVDPVWARPWGLVDVDWNSDKVDWSATKPMDCEENMLYNLQQIRSKNPSAITWLYRNGVKALPWFTSVRKLLENPSYWGFFMPYANCSSSPGVYICGPNATTNLYHDFEQTPTGDCGEGVQCGEYVFNHRNDSLREWFMTNYFFGPTAMNSPFVNGFYVDDDWSASGPSEMDKDAVEKMGMSPADVSAMTDAWLANQEAWRTAVWNAGGFEWFMFYGGQQTAPGWSQTDPQSTCAPFMRTNCGASSPSQAGYLFFGYSRVTHQQAWPLPSPTQDLAAFLLVRGPYAAFGYGWTGCADANHPFTRPADLDVDYGEPVGFCAETASGSGIFTREWTKATITLDCNAFNATIVMK